LRELLDIDVFLEFDTTILSQLTDLSLNCCHLLDDDIVLEYIAAYCTSLKVFKFSHVDYFPNEKYFHDIFRNNKNLEIIWLSGRDIDAWNKYNDEEINFEFSDDFLSVLSENCHLLQELQIQIEEGTFFSTPAIMKFIKSCPLLHTFEIEERLTPEEDDYEAIKENEDKHETFIYSVITTKNNSIQLTFPYFVVYDFVMNILKICNNNVTSIISKTYSDLISDEMVLYIANNFKNLTTFHGSDDNECEYSVQTALKLLTECKLLTEVSFGVAGWSNDELLTLFQTPNILTKLYLYDTESISGDTILTILNTNPQIVNLNFNDILEQNDAHTEIMSKINEILCLRGATVKRAHQSYDFEYYYSD
jgi:hypothetical protein